jgi:hypothetical protein
MRTRTSLKVVRSHPGNRQAASGRGERNVWPKAPLRRRPKAGRRRPRHGHVESGSEPACWPAEAARRPTNARKGRGVAPSRPTGPAPRGRSTVTGHRHLPRPPAQASACAGRHRHLPRPPAKANAARLRPAPADTRPGLRSQATASACASEHGRSTRQRTEASARAQRQEPRSRSRPVHRPLRPDGNIRPTGTPHPRVQSPGRWLPPRSLLQGQPRNLVRTTPVSGSPLAGIHGDGTRTSVHGRSPRAAMSRPSGRASHDHAPSGTRSLRSTPSGSQRPTARCRPPYLGPPHCVRPISPWEHRAARGGNTARLQRTLRWSKALRSRAWPRNHPRGNTQAAPEPGTTAGGHDPWCTTHPFGGALVTWRGCWRGKSFEGCTAHEDGPEHFGAKVPKLGEPHGWLRGATNSRGAARSKPSKSGGTTRTERVRRVASPRRGWFRPAGVDAQCLCQ